MAIDPYGFCPCGSGKKLKFCCSKDILGDVQKLAQLEEKDQYLAMVELAREITASHGPRAAILTIQALACLRLGELEEAQKTISQLRTVESENPTLLALEAQEALVDGDIMRALDKVQAVLADTSVALPEAFTVAVFQVATHLIRLGHILTAIYYLRFLANVLPGQYRDLPLSLLNNVRNSTEISFLQRDTYPFKTPDPSVPWHARFEDAHSSFLRLNLRGSRQQLQALIQDVGEEPVLLYDLGVTYLVDAQRDKAATYFIKYAEHPQVAPKDAADVLVVALHLGTPTNVPVTVAVELTYNLSDAGPVSELLLSDRRCQVITSKEQLLQLGLSRDPEGSPPPRLAATLLDRPKDAWQPGMPISELPQSIGEVLLYGRETDRPPRLIAICFEDERESAVVERVKALIGPELQGEVEREKVGEAATNLLAFEPRQVIPSDLPQAEAAKIEEEIRVAAYRERWCRLPHPWLDGQSPAEAVHDERLKNRVSALLILMELNWDMPSGLALTEELRQQLGLPQSSLDSEPSLDVNIASLVTLHRIDPQSLPDAALQLALLRLSSRGTITCQQRYAMEWLRRAEQNPQLSSLSAIVVLSNSSRDPNEQLSWLKRGVAEAEKQKLSPAKLLQGMIRLQLLQGDAEGLAANYRRLAEQHLNEAGVRETLQEIAQLIQASRGGRRAEPNLDDAVRVPGFVPKQAAAEAPAGKLWTPDSAAAPSDQSKPASKLWLPD